MQAIYLLRFTGDDQPGQSQAITTALARFGTRVLDINQTVVHQSLLLAMMVLIPEDQPADDALREVERVAFENKLRLSVDPITGVEYDQWVHRQGRPRFILTLLARSIRADRLAAVTRLVAEQGMNIDIITRLSGRPAIGDASRDRRACVEFALRGEPGDPEALRAGLMTISHELDCDLAWQRDDVFRRTRRLVAFDMDSTLIQAEVIDELAKEAGVGEEVAKVTESAMRGEIDFNQSLRQRVATLEGLPESTLRKVADRLVLTEGCETLLKNLHGFGYKTAILSGGFTYFGRHLQDKLGFTHVRANELEIVDGKLTGKVLGEIVNGQRKAELLGEIAQAEGIRLEQTIAVGDGANDLPMLGRAGLGIAFHAKPKVRAEASHHISTLGLDAVLFFLGVRDRDLVHEPVEAG